MMGIRTILCLTMLVACFPALAAANETQEAAKERAPAEAGVGRRIVDVQDQTVDGQQYQLSKALKDRKALVVAATSTSCPLSKKYLPTLAKLEAEYRDKGVGFLLLNPIATDTVAEIKQQLAATGFNGSYIHDVAGLHAKSLGLTTTTEVFLIDRARTIIYRGAIDDQYGIGYSRNEPQHQYLKEAIDAALAGKEPAVRATSAPGCLLDLSAATETAASNVTYHNRISRILQQNCQECHREGGVAPFTLKSLDDVNAHRAMIRKVVEQGTMPPWFAAKPSKGELSPFVNDRALTDADKADLFAWFAAGAPAGDVADAPLPRSFPADWVIGKPDLIVKLDKPIEIPATGVMPYQHATVETQLAEDQWIQGYEIRPTAKEVVHHILVFILPPKIGSEPRLALREFRPESLNYFAIYVPGNSAQLLPEGIAKKIPKGARLHFQIHYTPNGIATKDQTQIAFKFASGKPEKELHVYGIGNHKFEIPPGDDNYSNFGEVKLPTDVTLVSLMPHMHLRGKACKYVAELPDGSTKVLLDIPRYDFNWQLHYKFAEPITLPRGSKIVFTAWFDNSDKNPANPDPKQTVRWGQQTYEEMLLGYVEYYRTK